VDEFCRLFPIGDRRAKRIIEEQARIIGHEPHLLEAGGLPPEGDRRAPAEEAAPEQKPARVLLSPRTVAMVVDTCGVLAMAGGASYLLGTGFYETAGILAILYYGVATVTLGASAGTLLVGALRQRMPALFAPAKRRAAA
jgi:hypothetical protein